MLVEHLKTGIERSDNTGSPVLFRLIAPTDDLDALTEMLHAAYAPLAAAGMRFYASHQSVDVTRHRVQKGDTIVAVVDRVVSGTVTVHAKHGPEEPPFYRRDHVMHIEQFAVAPYLQRRGIGSMLMDVAEARAREQGASDVALDTSEHAAELIRFYESRGYRFVEHHRWTEVNYRSVVMAKAL